MKPCPFCKSKDILIRGIDESHKNPPFWVECMECMATGPEAETEEKAVELWNRREESE
jgi:Lar family restriction alleviation protein